MAQKQLDYVRGQISAQLDVDAKTLFVALPVAETPRLSTSGKSFIVAGVEGVMGLPISVNGESLKLTASAYIRNPSYVKPAK